MLRIRLILWSPVLFCVFWMDCFIFCEKIQAAPFIVYQIYQSVDLGIPHERPQKDFYINMGLHHGLRQHSTVEISRKISTFNQNSFYQDLIFPIAIMKVIYVEQAAAIVRLVNLLPFDQTPAMSPRMVMLGDLVRLIESEPVLKAH